MIPEATAPIYTLTILLYALKIHMPASISTLGSSPGRRHSTYDFISYTPVFDDGVQVTRGIGSSVIEIRLSMSAQSLLWLQLRYEI